jgi:trehalose 6-phosphate synthase/phosphatase
MPCTWIVSNRLPWTYSRDQHGTSGLTRSPGGLVSAMLPVYRSTQGWWVGHGGYPPELAEHCAREHLVDVELSEADYDAYYNGAANSCLWPIFHYFATIARFDAGAWEAYRRVNRAFAKAMLERIRPGDLVWVHDYHLMLLPGLLREASPDLRIGYFHHIPFPASEVFKLLPWREEIAEGLLGADLVGFHTLEYARHFTSVAGRLLGMEVRGEDIHHGDRVVRTGAFPIGIDTAGLLGAMRTPQHAQAVADAERIFAGKRLVLGVDRLDYTKGLRERLEAFAAFLQRHPDARHDTVLMLLCVPSRIAVDSYANLRQEIERLVSHINGTFGTTANQPVQYLFQTRELPELTALYRRADVCLVTPLRDGLNLVCKEYCAAREDLGGVLIISEFAGASEELGEALVVNPFDTGAVADAIAQGLAMPDAERRTRMSVLRQRVLDVDNRAWAGLFISALDAIADLNREHASRRLDSPEEFQAFSARLLAAPRVLAVLDSEAFTDRLARPGDLERLQARLQARLGGRLACLVVANAPRPDLQRGSHWLAAEFGALLRPPGGEFGAPAAELAELGSHRAEILRILAELVRKVPRSRLSEGRASISWTMGRTTSDMAKVLLRETRHAIEQILARGAWFCASTRRGLTVRSGAAGPVQAVEAVQRALGADSGTMLLTIGDRYTDEGLFRLHPERNCSVAIATPASAAGYLVADAETLLAACSADIPRMAGEPG